MEEMNRYGITESRTRGWGPTAFIILALVLLMVGVMFIMLWIATKSAESAALASVITILVLAFVGMMLWAFTAGSKQAHDADRDIVASMAEIAKARAAIGAGPIVEGEIVQQSQGRFLKSGNQMHLSTKVEGAAVAVWRELYPHTPPTRENIKAVTGSNSAEFCSLVLDYLRDKQLVRDGGQGKISAWK